ncbi:MAG TPA: hypothetical protein VFW83_02595 [Bryobacteraceae bacterium]|nr:hypothetical protein [Bryobacteraceae bacterium]
MKVVKRKAPTHPETQRIHRNVTTAPAGARPSSDFDLTKEERAILADPDWVTEDEEDIIIGERILAGEGDRPIPLEEVLKRHNARIDKNGHVHRNR